MSLMFSLGVAVEGAKGLAREVALCKVQRPVFCLPYYPRFPGVGASLRKRHRVLLAIDVDARE